MRAARDHPLLHPLCVSRTLSPLLASAVALSPPDAARGPRMRTTQALLMIALCCALFVRPAPVCDRSGPLRSVGPPFIQLISKYIYITDKSLFSFFCCVSLIFWQSSL